MKCVDLGHHRSPDHLQLTPKHQQDPLARGSLPRHYHHLKAFCLQLAFPDTSVSLHCLRWSKTVLSNKSFQEGKCWLTVTHKAVQHSGTDSKAWLQYLMENAGSSGQIVYSDILTSTLVAYMVWLLQTTWILQSLMHFLPQHKKKKLGKCSSVSYKKFNYPETK